MITRSLVALVGWWLSWAGTACAQGLAPDTLVNTVYEKFATSGIFFPNATYLLANTGLAYRVDQFRGPLELMGRYTWTKTGPNTGTLVVGAQEGTTITFNTAATGTYQERLGGGGVSFRSFPLTSKAPLRNFSSRMTLGAGQTATTGFVVAGAAPRRVLVRAVGPSLATFGVERPADAPTLTVLRGSTTVGTNSGWGGAATLSAAFASVGAFGLAPASRDSALLLALEPGDYTTQVRDAAGGEVLVEVYFLN